MRAVKLSLVLAATSLGALGCNPCGQGLSETKDGGPGYADIGIPGDAVACKSDTDASQPPVVVLPKTTVAVAMTKLTAKMVSRGWMPVTLPEKLNKQWADRLAAGGDETIPVIFGKDGTKERRYGEITPSSDGAANISLSKDACEPTSTGAVIDQCL